MKNFFYRIFVNLKITIIAVIIVILIVIVSKNPQLFKASILMMEDRQIMLDNQRDIAYKNSDNLLDVFLSEKITDIDRLSISIIYDTRDITLQKDQIQSQIDYDINENNIGEMIINMTNNTGIDYNQSLFTMPFSGERALLLLGEAVVVDTHNNNKNLAIGNLDEAKQEIHQK